MQKIIKYKVGASANKSRDSDMDGRVKDSVKYTQVIKSLWRVPSKWTIGSGSFKKSHASGSVN